MTLKAKALEAAKRAAAKALQAKYREFWSGSWPDTESAIELFDAAQAAYLSSLPHTGVGEEIIAPAECDPSCDDLECPYSHQPLTLRQAYENALSRLRAAEAALSSQQEEAVPVGSQSIEMTDAMEAAFFQALEDYDVLKRDLVFPRKALPHFVWDRVMEAANAR